MCKHELALKHKGRAKQKQGKGKGKKKLARDQSNEGGARSASRAQNSQPRPKRNEAQNDDFPKSIVVSMIVYCQKVPCASVKKKGLFLTNHREISP